MKIAVEGCAHGEIDKIYEVLEYMEKKYNIKIDLLIICGDFQAVRNLDDLKCMSVPTKYRKLNTFYKYYSGEKVAPILTIFVGGNHEASNYLSELSYGGWVCPNIFYMGYANVINIGGLRIAGLSGIYKGIDFFKGHFEIPPYDQSSVKSVYHIRNIDVFRLKQIRKAVDICISHDWPRGVYNFGNKEELLRKKPFFKEEMDDNKLGSVPAEELLKKLQPTYWFAAHLHCKFAALIPHNNNGKKCYTKFLALDKCLPHRSFLQILDIGGAPDNLTVEYDPEWLCILQSTEHLLNTTKSISYMPGAGGQEKWDFSPTEEELEKMHKLFNGNFKIPNNFTITAPPHNKPNDAYDNFLKPYINPQTTEFCRLLEIKDPFAAVLNETHNSLTISDFSFNDSCLRNTSSSLDPDEIIFSDKDLDDDVPSKDEDIDLDSSSDLYFIDKKGSGVSKCLSSNYCSTPQNEKTLDMNFPEFKDQSLVDVQKTFMNNDPEDNRVSNMKRRNSSLYLPDYKRHNKF